MVLTPSSFAFLIVKIKGQLATDLVVVHPSQSCVLPPIIIHERLAEWGGRLRSRWGDDPAVRWVESRSAADLVAAARGSMPAIVLINLAHRTYWGMEGLEALDAVPHNALILVLDPLSVPEVPTLARELGATLVWPGVVVPPQVEALFRRWLALIGPEPADARRFPRSLAIDR